MQSNLNVCYDCPKVVIKPSLHSVTTETISSKILKNSKTNDRNSHSMPFRVISRESRHQSKDLIHSSETFGQSTDSLDTNLFKQNNYPKLSDEFEDIFRQMFANHYSNGDNKQNKTFFKTLNTTENTNLKTSNDLRPSSGQSYTRNNRLYNSCPSSPVQKRFHSVSDSLSDLSLCSSATNDIRFSDTHGLDVTLSPDLLIASRREDIAIGSNCYVFVDHYFTPGMEITIEIKSLDEFNVKQSFVFGVTDVQPSAIATTLPDDPNMLITRRDELWVMVDKFCDQLKVSDKIIFTIDSKGFVYFSVNSQPKSVLFPTQVWDQSRKLWPFFDIIGKIKAIKLVVKSGFIGIDKESVKRNIFNIKSVKHLYKCLNCSSNYANTAFYRCGHKYFCYQCSQLLANANKKCPICRFPIYDLLLVFP